MLYKRFHQAVPPFHDAISAPAKRKTSWFTKKILEEGKPFEIAIIGGGPASSFFAKLFIMGAMELATHKERDRVLQLLQLHIYEPRDASTMHHKGCGLGSGLFIADDFKDINMLQTLQDFGAPTYPITKFRYISPVGSFDLDIAKEFPWCSLYATNRASSSAGPSMDLALQNSLKENKAVNIHNHLVVETNRCSDGKFQIVSADPSGGMHNREVDFLIGAFGVDTASAEMFKKIHPSYRPPAIKRMIQREMCVEDDSSSRARDTISVFAIPTTKDMDFSIHFLALIPKVDKDGNVSMTATVRYALKRPGARINSLDVFRYTITHPIVTKVFPCFAVESIGCICTPFAVVAQGESVVDDGLAIIGDAGLSPRLYKNGLSGAYISARILAETILIYGPDAGPLEKRFVKRMRRRFDWRNLCGMMTMNMYDRLNLEWGAFGPILQEIIRYANGRKALAAISTGVYSYPDIFLRFAALGAVGSATSVLAGKLSSFKLFRLWGLALYSKPWKFRGEFEELMDEVICEEEISESDNSEETL
ncbi:hypothetical protein MNBD_NITROSPINAE04-1055 [hydrothermal vent metagenome]|uniref:Uncharacterized protein n=1 Tax=hydrothermal vent metagenome TaxID=652676 RepID=A0A3B1C2B3_9ZZZZ